MLDRCRSRSGMAFSLAMAFSKLTICNGALQKIGVPRIMSVDEDSKEAKICNSEYDKVRKTLLRMYPWGFASARAQLAPVPDAPVFEYEYAFELPADCLRIVELFEYDGEYKVEGTQLLMNSNDLKLKYIRDVTDITRCDSLFADAFEWYLGFTISRYLTESDTVRQEAWAGFRNVMPMAKFIQSTENNQRQVDSYEFVDSRFGYGFPRDPMTH